MTHHVMNDTSRQNKDASMIAFFIAGAFASRRVAYIYTALFSTLYKEALNSSDEIKTLFKTP